MSKRVYIGIDTEVTSGTITEIKSVARRVKKIYVGVNGIAKKVKRAYIGISNVARQFFGGFESIQKVSSPTRFVQSSYDDSVNNASLQGAAAGNLANKYAVFAGSFTQHYVGSAWTYYPSKYVYAVDKDLTVTSASNLGYYSAWLQPANLKDYIVFGYGYSQTTASTNSSSPNPKSKYAYAYDEDLTRHDLADLYNSTFSKNYATAAGNGAYAIYPFWMQAVSSFTDDKLTTYNNNLIQSVISTDGTYDGRIGSIDACRFNDYAVFFGTMTDGSSSAQPSKNVYAYDQDLIKHEMSQLSDGGTFTYPRQCIATKNYVVLAGGRTSDSGADNLHEYLTTLEVYNKNLIKISTTASLSYWTEWFGRLAIDDWIIFCGGHYGYTNTGSFTNATAKTIDIFDETLIRTTDELTNGLYYLEGASVGDYGILVGYGNSNNTVIFQGV